jgi:hypothetical protein
MYRVLEGKLEGRIPLEILGVGGRILRCTLKKLAGKILNEFIWLKTGTNGRPI